LGLNLDKGLRIGKKRRFRFRGKSKILGLSLDFEEGREKDIRLEFELYYVERRECLIWRRLFER